MADNMALMLLGFKDYDIEGIEDAYDKAKHYKRISLTYSGDIPAVCPVCSPSFFMLFFLVDVASNKLGCLAVNGRRRASFGDMRRQKQQYLALGVLFAAVDKQLAQDGDFA